MPTPTYLTQTANQPLLTCTEEVELARLVETGDRAARARLITANLRLVVAIARRCVGHGLDLDDLVQEGNLGLVDAVDRFDARRGTRFAAYAAQSIRAAIEHALSNTSRTDRLDVSAQGPAREPAETVHERAQNAALDDALARLPERRRHVLELRYGLRGQRARTLREAASELEITHQRVRQIEVAALHRIAREQDMQIVQDLRSAA